MINVCNVDTHSSVTVIQIDDVVVTIIPFLYLLNTSVLMDNESVVTVLLSHVFHDHDGDVDHQLTQGIPRLKVVNLSIHEHVDLVICVDQSLDKVIDQEAIDVVYDYQFDLGIIERYDNRHILSQWTG